MAKYGRDYYGIGFYGPFTVSDFNAYPFTAFPSGYGRISLSWTNPTGNWSQIRVIRNSYGFPTSAADGIVIVDSFVNSAPTEYVDAGDIIDGEVQYLTEGKFYYYSVFVRENINFTWLRAANAVGISVKDFNTSNDLYDYLPDSYKVNSLTGDVLSEADNLFLKNFLKIFGFEYDIEKTYALNFLDLYKIDSLPGQLLPQMLEQFGGCFEPEVGLKQQRVLLRNLFNIYKEKGTYDGLLAFIKSFSGYDSIVEKGKNLFLDYNDSSFEESIGNWTISSGGTLTRYVGDPLIIEPYEVTAPVGYPSSDNGMLRFTSTGTGSVSFTCGVNNPITKGIPVTEGETYTFSIFSAASTTTRNIRLGIQFYDRFGVALGVLQQGVPVSNATLAWDSPTLRPFATAIAPTDAHYASVAVNISNTAVSEIHYFDAAQFEEAISKTAFEDARRINITLKANRINEITNPSFTLSSSPWAATNAALTLDSSKPGVDIREFVVVNKELSSNTATLTVSDSYLPIFIGDNIVVSGVGSPFDGAYVVTASDPIGKTVSYAKVNAPISSTAVSPSGLVSIAGDSLKVTPSGVSLVSVVGHTTTTDYFNVLSGNDYTFSVYVEPETTSELVTASISWYTSLNTLISTVNGLPTQCPPTYNITQAVLSGNVATITLNEGYDFLNYAGNDKSFILVDGLGSPYDGTWQISSVLNNTISYAVTNTNIPLATVSGTASPVGIWYRVSVTDTAPSLASSVTAASASAGVITYIANNSLSIGQIVSITGLSTNAFNLKDVVVASASSTQFTVTNPATGTSVTGEKGTVSPLLKASVKVSWTPSNPGAVVYLEDALFEKASFVLDYFDGSRSGQEDSTSLVWEGAVEASRSHFYKNKFAVEDRLKREISKNILLGSTFALYFAQPD